MKSMIMKHLKWLAFGLAISVVQLNGQIKVSFSSEGQTVDETGSIRFGIELSEPSLLEVSVPYIISSASTLVLDQDYEIVEDDLDNNIDNVSPIVFAPGVTKKFVNIQLINDNNKEEDEFLIVDLVESGLTVVQLGEITQHRVRVIDNDAINVYFPSHNADFQESGNISIPIKLSSRSADAVEVSFEIDFLSATPSDVDLSDSFTTNSPLTINAGTTTSAIRIKIHNDSITDRNENGADRETIRVRITGAELVDTGSLEFDSDPFVATIVDNDPLTLEFDDDNITRFEFEEFENAPIRLRLVDQNGDESATGAEIEIPISYSGSAKRGTADDDDYESEDDVVKILAGSSHASFTLVSNNDDLEEDDETVILAIGDAKYKDGGDLWIGDNNTMNLTLKDNDPIQLSFGAFYSKDDEAAAESETDDIDDTVFVPSQGFMVPEFAQKIRIPFYLSSVSSHAVEFDLVMKRDGTSATLLDQSKDAADQNWDYVVTNFDLQEFEKSVRVSIRAGVSAGTINLTLNNDAETPIIYGENPAADVEEDESVQFEISNINTADSFVSMGESSSFALTIKEMPDIDITNIMSGLSPVASKLVNGTPKFNELTGLFEVSYEMNLTEVLDPNQFPGYGSLKVQFRTSNYDASNPDAEGNDPLFQDPFNPGPDAEFHYFVDTPFQLRYHSNSERITLVEGEEAQDEKYDESTADTIEVAPYILKPIAFPRLNDFEAESTDSYDLNGPLNWTIDFYSKGHFVMPIDRIDPAVNPDRMRVYLTAESTPVLASFNSSASLIKSIEPQIDGSMLLQINTSGNSVQIQYLDAGSEWKIAQPASIQMGNGTHLYWIDKGPPQTDSHPSTQNFRLYRATQN